MYSQAITKGVVVVISVVGLLATGAAATPIYETDLSYQGQQGDKYAWTLHVKNASLGTDDNDSGVALKVNAEKTADMSYSGGTIGDFWQTDNIADNYFESRTWSPLGNIDPIALDPMADELWIDFLSDYKTLVDSTVDISTLGNGNVTVNQQLPGEVPEPATIGLLGAGLAGLLRRRG